MSDATNEADPEYYPEFRRVRRGYDPDEVEAILDDLYAALGDAARRADERTAEVDAARGEQQQLKAALAEAQRRVAELESRLVGRTGSLDNVGSHVDDILAAAAVEAGEILRRAEAKAQAVQAEAKAAAAELAGVQDRASAEAQRLLAAAHREAEIVRTEAGRIRAEALEGRALVRAQLAEVRERVARALAGDDVPAVEADRPTPTPGDEGDAGVPSGPSAPRLSEVSDGGVRR